MCIGIKSKDEYLKSRKIFVQEKTIKRSAEIIGYVICQASSSHLSHSSPAVRLKKAVPMSDTTNTFIYASTLTRLDQNNQHIGPQTNLVFNHDHFCFRHVY